MRKPRCFSLSVGSSERFHCFPLLSTGKISESKGGGGNRECVGRRREECGEKLKNSVQDIKGCGPLTTSFRHSKNGPFRVEIPIKPRLRLLWIKSRGSEVVLFLLSVPAHRIKMFLFQYPLPGFKLKIANSFKCFRFGWKISADYFTLEIIRILEVHFKNSRKIHLPKIRLRLIFYCLTKHFKVFTIVWRSWESCRPHALDVNECILPPCWLK